jgi:hypothetical protein
MSRSLIATFYDRDDNTYSMGYLEVMMAQIIHSLKYSFGRSHRPLIPLETEILVGKQSLLLETWMPGKGDR